MKKFFRIVGYAVGLFLFLLTLLAAFTQTKLFKDRLRVFIASTITTQTGGFLSLGTIKGNFITGFTIDPLTLRIDDEEIISTGAIAFSYDLFAALRDRIVLHSLTIDHPNVSLIRNVRGEWNLGKLLPSGEPVEPSEFPWLIKIEKLRIRNGSLTILDEHTLLSPEHRRASAHQVGPDSYIGVDYHDISLFNLDVELEAEYRQNDARVSISKLSFESIQPEFSLKHLGGEFSATPQGVAAKNMILVTAHSNVKLDASLQGVDLFSRLDLAALQYAPVRLTVLADKIDLNELKQFIEPINFLNGVAFVHLQADGEFGKLAIQHLELQTYNTALRLQGALHNLHQPEDLFINVMIENSRITPGDANRLLPPFHIPRFDNVGPIDFFAQFVGKPLNFTAKAVGNGNIGSFATEARLNLEGEEMEYDASVDSRNLQLHNILDGLGFESILTAQAKIKGRGTSPKTLAATARINLDSAQVRGVPLAISSVTLSAQRERIEATADLRSQEMKLHTTCIFDFSHPQRTALQSDFTIANLDLARILHDRYYRSDLNLTGSVATDDLDLNDMSGTLKLVFSPSSFQHYSFEAKEVTLALHQKETEANHITLTSPLMDAELRGHFSLASVIERLGEEVENMHQAIAQRAASFSPERTLSPAVSKKHHVSPNRDRFEMTYDVVVKDLEPLAVFLGRTTFNARSTIRGSVAADAEHFEVAAEARIDEFFVGTLEKGSLVENAAISLAMSTQPASSGKKRIAEEFFQHLSVRLDAFAGYGILNRISFDSSQLSVAFENSVGTYEIRSLIDSLMVLQARGNVHVSEDAFDVAAQSLKASFRDLTWRNSEEIQAIIDTSGVHLIRFRMENDRGGISLRGSLTHDGTLDAELSAKLIELADAGHYFGTQPLNVPNQAFSGGVDLDVKISGTLDNPWIRLSAEAENVAFRNRRIGRLIGLLNYERQLLTIDMKIADQATQQVESADFSITGSVPIDLAFRGVEQRFPDQRMDLRVVAQGLQLGVFDPLIDGIDELHGQLSCNLTVGGTPAQPLYGGWIKIAEGRFLFRPNNIHYKISGTLEADGEKLRFIDVEVANEPRDRTDAVTVISGALSIKNFAIDSFDLAAHGQLLIIKESTRQAMPTMYGTLLAAIGSDGLHWRGTLGQSSLTGVVFIREANLIFPATRGQAYIVTDLALNYRVVDDTSRDAGKERLARRFFSDVPPHTGQANGPSGGTHRTSRSLWDGLVYDVRIETQGTTEIRMVFNPATNEELFAELDGRVVVQRSEAGPRVTGEIAISERSHYTFFKRFNASGTLKFVGPPDNPELNIKAFYEGTRRPPELPPDTVGVDEKVVITLAITGTRYEPKLAITVKVDDVDRSTQAKGGDVESDAISFILTGKFRDDLTTREKSDIVSTVSSAAGTSILYGVPSQMLSGVLTNFLRNEFSFIRSAEITYQGGSLQESADLRLSGEVFRGYWRFGGRIFNDIGNANVSIVFRMGEVFAAPRLSNMYVELERKVEGTDYVEHRRSTNAARIYYKFSF